MCGIAGVYLRDPEAKGDLNAMLDTMLDEIEHRGGDATGFVAVGAEGINEWQKAACGAKDFCRYRRPVPKGTRTFLAHTRYATLGLPAFVENNHPLKRGGFVVVHNGHIQNHNEVFAKAKRTPYGQVDSECIPARFASLGSLSAAPKVMADLEGAAAIAAVDEAKPGELLLARGYSSPLFVLQTKKYVLWGSTHSAVAETYKKHIGALPKRAKIVSLATGTALHFVEGKVSKLKFRCYEPPKVKYTYTPSAWKETSTEVSQVWTPGDWKREERSILGISSTTMASEQDMVECDLCNAEVAWRDAQYVKDKEGYTWHLCQVCNPEIVEAWDIIDGNLVTDEVATVSEYLLSEDDSE